jgi:hypothetical protein
MKHRTIAVAFIALAALLSVGSIASAQNDPHWLGTSRSGFTAGLAKPQQSTIPLTALYTSASYGTGGVALRNRSKGDLHISGVTGPTQAAWLYWAVLLSSPTAAQLKAATEVSLQREYPTGPPASAQQIHGTLLAIGGDPCWSSQGTWVYRGAVPTNVATGNGIYRVIVGNKAVGLSDGEDPWDGNVVFPAWEGASLVIIGTGTANVGLLDGQAGTTFGPATLSNYYTLPAPVGPNGSLVLLDNIGYDGQIGNSRSIQSGPGYSTTNESTNVTGIPSGISVLVVGNPGGETGDSDWDGSSGWPLPQLWDDTGHDISNAFAPGDNLALVSYTSTDDCVGTVAAVISVQ